MECPRSCPVCLCMYLYEYVCIDIYEYAYISIYEYEHMTNNLIVGSSANIEAFFVQLQNGEPVLARSK